MTRIIFFGTPSFAVPTLRYLATDRQFIVSLVVTQPDRPAGRGRRLEPSPVAVAARELGLPIYQPASLRPAAAREPLAAAGADLFIVAAFGLIFGPKVLALPRLGCVNVHASLLPRYRGAAPISAAILNGDAMAGVTLMQMEIGLDTGPMLGADAVTVAVAATTASLTDELAIVGEALIGDVLPTFVAGAITPMPQPSADASLTRPLRKADGWLDWRQPAAMLEREVRAFWPWPRAWTSFPATTLQVHAASVVATHQSLVPGEVTVNDGRLVVGCGADALRLSTVQAAGGRPLTDTEWLAGRPALPDRLDAVQDGAARAPLIVPV